MLPDKSLRKLSPYFFGMPVLARVEIGTPCCHSDSCPVSSRIPNVSPAIALGKIKGSWFGTMVNERRGSSSTNTLGEIRVRPNELAASLKMRGSGWVASENASESCSRLDRTLNHFEAWTCAGGGKSSQARLLFGILPWLFLCRRPRPSCRVVQLALFCADSKPRLLGDCPEEEICCNLPPCARRALDI